MNIYTKAHSFSPIALLKGMNWLPRKKSGLQFLISDYWLCCCSISLLLGWPIRGCPHLWWPVAVIHLSDSFKGYFLSTRKYRSQKLLDFVLLPHPLQLLLRWQCLTLFSQPVLTQVLFVLHFSAPHPAVQSLNTHSPHTKAKAIQNLQHLNVLYLWPPTVESHVHKSLSNLRRVAPQRYMRGFI